MCTLLPDALERLREKDQVQGQPELHRVYLKNPMQLQIPLF